MGGGIDASDGGKKGRLVLPNLGGSLTNDCFAEELRICRHLGPAFHYADLLAHEPNEQ